MMAYVGAVLRWEIYWADLDPAVGSEQAGASRPVLVLSNDDVNRMLPIVTVVPMTKLEHKKRRLYPADVQLPENAVGNGWTPVAMPYQVRTISKLRLLGRIGVLRDAAARARIEHVLLDHLGIEVNHAA